MFVDILPKYLFIQRPDKEEDIEDSEIMPIKDTANHISYPSTNSNGLISPLKTGLQELTYGEKDKALLPTT